MTEDSQHLHAPQDDRPLRGRLTVRLIVAVPALLTLLVIAFGYTVLSILFHYAAQEPNVIGVGVPWGQAEKWTLLAMLVFFALAIAAGLTLAFSILSPLQSISQALERAARGALDAPLHVAGAGSELRSIGRSFNSMVTYLNQVFQERNRYLMDNVQSGTLVLDERNRVLEMNEVAEEYLGIRLDEAAGAPLEELARRPELEPSLRSLIDAFQSMLASGKIVQAAQSLPAAEEDGARFSYSCALRKNESGRPIGYQLSFRDMSRGEKMRQLLARTDQLAALGAFTMGLAHELRNPLGSIRGLAQLLEENQEEDSPNSNFAGRIVQEVDRLDGFIRELLDFGQQSSQTPVPCDLARLAEEALQAAQAGSELAREKNLRLETQLHSAHPVLLQRERIVRSLTGIILNAFEACPPKGKLRVATSTVGKGLAAKAICEIENTGPPIPEDDLERIFEPFYTTKPKGSGLGLAIASQIVIQNGGSLTAERRSQGAKFVLAFQLSVIGEQ